MDSAAVTEFAKWFSDKNFVSVRSIMLYVAVWMTAAASKWAAHYADLPHEGMSGTDQALIIAAATAPITAFTAFVYKWYSNSRDNSATAGKD